MQNLRPKCQTHSFFSEKSTTFGEGTQLIYSCHIQYVFVPNYDYFFSLQKSNLDLLLNCVHQFRINFQHCITKISCLKHNYFLCWKSTQDLVLIILVKHDYLFMSEN